MRAWVALRPSSVESRFEALHGAGLTALIGREEELELLSRLVASKEWRRPSRAALRRSSMAGASAASVWWIMSHTALEDDHLRGCSASAWHESIAGN